MSEQDEKRFPALEEAVHFTGACLAIGWGLALALYFSVGPRSVLPAETGNSAAEDGREAVYMAAWLLMALAPGLIALGLKVVRKTWDGEMGLPARGWHGYGRAFLLAAGYLALSFGISWILGLVRFDPELKGLRDQLGGVEGMGTGRILTGLGLWSSTIWPLLLVAPLFVEEYGWRGYLLKRLRPLGVPTAVLLTGLFWALWQLPILLLRRPYDPAPFWAGVPLALAVMTATGAILGLLALEFRSVWVPALAQSVAVAHMGVYGLFLSEVRPLLGGPIGLTGLVLCALYLAWWVRYRRTGFLPRQTGAGEGVAADDG